MEKQATEAESVLDMAGLDNLREILVVTFREAIFGIALSIHDLPSLNPLDLFLVAYPQLRERNPRLNRAVKIVSFVIFVVPVVYLVLAGQSPTIWILLIIYTLAFVVPLSYLFYTVWHRIRLTMFSEYLKKRILKELLLLRDSYSMLRNLPRFQEHGAALDKGLKETGDYEKTFAKPRFLRNVTLGSLSSVAGLLGVVFTAISGQSLPLQLAFLGESLSGSLTSSTGVLFAVVPLYVFFSLIVLPIAAGIRESEKYWKSNVQEKIDSLRSKILEMIPTEFHKIGRT